MSRREIFRYIRYGKLDRQRLILLLLIVLLLTIAYLSFGASQSTEFGVTEVEVSYGDGPPEEISLPNHGSDGFNLTGGNFPGLPSFNPPNQFFNNSAFNPDDWGGNFNFSNPGILTGPGFSFPSFGGFPTIGFPSWNPPTFNPTVSQPTVNPTISAPSRKNNTNGDFSLEIPDRQNKARNLPILGWEGNFSLDIKIPGLPDVELNVKLTFEGIVFVSVLFTVLYFNKVFLPKFLDNLEKDELYGEVSKAMELFVKPSEKKLKEQEEKRIRARLRKLLLFKDHVEIIIKDSSERLPVIGPEETIVKGYHDLDHAFSVFTSLNRSKDTTPLEHSQKHFETGEIDNDRLSKIVDLFYVTRFGKRNMKKDDALKFIEHLQHLVIHKEKEVDVNEV